MVGAGEGRGKESKIQGRERKREIRGWHHQRPPPQHDPLWEAVALRGASVWGEQLRSVFGCMAVP